MLSLQLILQIIAGLGPYFTAAILLAIFLGLFLPWGVMNPQKWLYFYIIGLSLLPFGGNDPDGGGSLYKQITWGLLYVLCFVIITRSRKEIAAPKISFPVELVLLYAFLLLTIIWSDYRLSSFKRYILLIGLLLIAILSSKLSMVNKSFARIVDKPFAAFMLLGAVAAVALPNLAFDSDGALRAFTTHKNTWGQFMLLCAIIFLNNILTRNGRRSIYIPFLMVALAMLYLSKSATSLLSFAVSSFCVLLVYGFSSKNLAGKLIVLMGVLVGAVGVLVYSVLHGALPFDALIEMVYKVTDKSSTLTGRTQLWQLMWAEIVRHPMLGTGFGGFWVGQDGPSGALGRRLDWGPPTQAHNGYIDGLNEIGAVGMLLFTVVIIGHLYRCFRLYAVGMKDHFLLHLAIVVSFMVSNYAESSLIQGTNLWWIITTCSIIEVYNRLRVHTAEQAAQKRLRHGNRHLPAGKST